MGILPFEQKLQGILGHRKTNEVQDEHQAGWQAHIAAHEQYPVPGNIVCFERAVPARSH